MADVKNWPWLLNQPFPEDMGYPAEIVRGQHFDSTSGGNGVSSPRALKVQAQAAPDGSVQILPGGGTAVSNYAGVVNQSYQATNFKPYTLEVPPTGSSSGGRHDLIIQRFLDPQYEKHPDADGELTPEVAATLDFWWFEVVEGRSATTKFSFPHVKLAHLKRPANTTIVEDSHITDLRELASPKKDMHVHALNMPAGHEEAITSTTKVWPEESSHYVEIPVWATRVKIIASWDQVRAHREEGDSGPAHGNARIHLVAGGLRVETQQTHWNTSGEQNFERFSIALADTLSIPEQFRGRSVQVQFRAAKYPGPNAYVDSNTSTSLIMFFEQGIV